MPKYYVTATKSFTFVVEAPSREDAEIGVDDYVSDPSNDMDGESGWDVTAELADSDDRQPPVFVFGDEDDDDV